MAPGTSAEGPIMWMRMSQEEENLVSEESAGSVVSQPRFSSKGRARLALGAATVGACLAGAVLLRWSAAPCVPSLLGGDVFISLAEADPEELVTLGDAGQHGDAVAAWLAKSSAAAEAAGEQRLTPELQSAMEKAMRVEDPEEAKRVIEEAVKKAGPRWEERRRDLQRHLGHGPLGARTPADKASVASCVFDVLQASSQLAALAAGLNDAANICPHANEPGTIAAPQICAVNAIFIVYSIATIASSLSLAANNCAETVVPNVNALCSGAITGLIAALSQFGASAAMVGFGCNPPIANIPPLITPSNLGQSLAKILKMPAAPALAAPAPAPMLGATGPNETNGTNETGEGAEPAVAAEMPAAAPPADAGMAAPAEGAANEAAAGEAAPAGEGDVAETSPAPPRRLLFGGDKGSTATWCAVDLTSAAWYLAQAGIAINAAANPKAGKTCPPRDSLSKTKTRRSQGFCAVNVEGAIFGFLQAVYFLSFAAVHCTDTVNLKALCSAGISGLLSFADQVAYTGTSLWLACDEFRDKGLFHPTPRDPRLKTNALGNSGIYGRRLSEDTEQAIAELKKRFKSPAEAWSSIGFHLNDTSAEFRQVLPLSPSEADFARLVQEIPAEAKESVLGAQQCK